jgi:hypothetical protein
MPLLELVIVQGFWGVAFLGMTANGNKQAYELSCSKYLLPSSVLAIRQFLDNY